MANLKITLQRSLIGRKEDQIATAKSMGLRKIGSSTIQPKNSQTEGKVRKISHLVTVEEQED